MLDDPFTTSGEPFANYGQKSLGLGFNGDVMGMV
jgi:hypothetical protein